ncbi:MAG TPA: DUF5317 family protein [Actinomycetota bacterium]
MLLIGAILGVGALLGIGLGGDPRNLAHLRLRVWWLAPVALAMQITPVSGGDGLLRWTPIGLLLGSYVVMGVFAVANLRLRGFGVILVGLLMNVAVIGANQGMPVSAGALERVGHAEDIAVLRDAEPGSKHHLEEPDDVLLPLADVIPIAAPFDAIISVGDVFTYGGAAVFLAMALLGRAVRREPARNRRRKTQPASWS